MELKIISKDIKTLLQQITGLENEICISLFYPVKGRCEYNTDGSMRLKLLAEEGRNELESQCKNSGLVDAITSPLFEIANNYSFSQHPYDSLAIFSCRQFCNTLPLPYTVDEKVIIDRCFYTKDLLPLYDKIEDEYYQAV